jgi:hypothetical protein
VKQLTLRGFDNAGAFELPDFDTFSASFEFSDVGAMTLSYPTNGINANRIFDNAEIALLCNGVEVDNGRWIVLAIDGDENPNQVDLIKAACRSNHSIFENTLVLGVDPDAPTKVTFADKTPGFILNYLFTQAQARGAMTGFTFASFSDTETTSEEAWAQNYTIEYKPGVKYIEILRELVDKGLIEYKIVGKDIRVYNADEMGVDRTLETPPVVLRSGRDFSEAPFKRTVDDYASDVVVEGDNSSFVRDQDATTHPYGRQEIYITQSGTADVGTLAIIAESALSARSEPRMEKTRKVEVSQETEFFPILDYMPSDYIYHVASGQPERLRVRMLTVQMDKDGFIDGSLVLNDKLLEADIIQARKIEGILNGSTSSPNGPPAGSYTDYTIPEAPEIVSVTSAQYSIKSGPPQAAVTVTITPPTLNTDNSLCTDLAFTVARWRYDEAGFPTEWVDVQGMSGNSVTFSGVATSADIEVEAAVIDNANHVSAWSATETHTTAEDTTAPPAPTTPSIASKLGNIVVSWTGAFAGAAPRPEDFSHVEVYVSTSSISDPPPGGTALKGILEYGSSMVVSNIAYNTTVYCRLFAVDKSGNRSVASTQASTTNLPLIRTDLSSSSVTYNEIAYKDSGNLIQDGSFEVTTINSLRQANATGSVSFYFGAGWNTHGSYILRIVGAASAKTVPLTNHIECVGDEKYYMRGLFYNEGTANGNIYMTFEWTDQAGAVTYTDISATPAATTTWEQHEGVVVVPSTAVRMRILIRTSGHTTGYFNVDLVEARPIIQTILIDDAAITNAKIADASIDTAKINSLSASKIEAGTITADKISLTVMQSNLVRNGSFEDNIPFDQATDSYIPLVPSLHAWTEVALNSGTGGEAEIHCKPLFKRSGKTSMSLTKFATLDGVYIESESFPVIDETTYHFGGYSYLGDTSPDAQIRYSLYLYDGTWSEDVMLTETIDALYTTPHKSEFSHYMPTGTTAAKLRVYNYQGDSAETQLHVEDLYALEEGVGAVVQSPYGIKMFGSTGEETINLNAVGSSITGAKISTASSGNRIVIEEDTDLVGKISFNTGHELEEDPGLVLSGYKNLPSEFFEYSRTSNVATIQWYKHPIPPDMLVDMSVVSGDHISVSLSADSSFDTDDALIISTTDLGAKVQYANVGPDVSAVYDSSGITGSSWYKLNSPADSPFVKISPPHNASESDPAHILITGARVYSGSIGGPTDHPLHNSISINSLVTDINSDYVNMISDTAGASIVMQAHSIQLLSALGSGFIDIGRTSDTIGIDGSVFLGSALNSVNSPGIYNTPLAVGANVYVHSNGIMCRATSSIRYKHDVIEVGEASLADVIPEERAGGIDPSDPFRILNVAPVAYRADNEFPETEGLSRLGFIAEDVAAKMPGVETRNEEGEVEGFDMNQIVASILAVVQKHEKVLNDNGLE